MTGSGAVGTDGFCVFDHDPRVARWAQAARNAALECAADPEMRGADNLRHGATWFVGVDALPNAPDGSIGGVPLAGPWQGLVPALPLHRAQLSIIYRGYPKQDAGESDANHRFRRVRAAAHVDGLLPVGPDKRRFACEFHAYILSLPLGGCTESPTVVWRGSQQIMQRALRDAYAGKDPAQLDITQVYQDARRAVFASCEQVPLPLIMGQSALLHPFVLHGTQAWNDEADTGKRGTEKAGIDKSDIDKADVDQAGIEKVGTGSAGTGRADMSKSGIAKSDRGKVDAANATLSKPNIGKADTEDGKNAEGRMIAFFRPECAGGAAEWLATP